MGKFVCNLPYSCVHDEPEQALLSSPELSRVYKVDKQETYNFLDTAH